MGKGRRVFHGSSSDIKKPHKYFYLPGNRDVDLNSIRTNKHLRSTISSRFLGLEKEPIGVLVCIKLCLFRRVGLIELLTVAFSLRNTVSKCIKNYSHPDYRLYFTALNNS